MATKNKAPKAITKRLTNDSGTPATPTSNTVESNTQRAPEIVRPDSTATEPVLADATQAIKKGIYLSVLVYIEGMQAPAADFTRTATDALKKALQSGVAGDPKGSGLSFSLKKVEVQNEVEQDDQEGSPKKEDKFQF